MEKYSNTLMNVSLYIMAILIIFTITLSVLNKQINYDIPSMEEIVQKNTDQEYTATLLGVPVIKSLVEFRDGGIHFSEYHLPSFYLIPIIITFIISLIFIVASVFIKKKFRDKRL